MGESTHHRGRRGEDRRDDQRQRIAAEAARLISELGLRDYHQAKLRAAQRLGIQDERHLPRNTEIENALREYQRLFGGEDRLDYLRALRQCAVEAMQFFHAFEPRLVGAVLEGTADQYSAVCLHLFCDNPEALALFLDENGIPYEQIERQLRWSAEEIERVDAYRFSADDMPLDLTLLPLDALRQAPLDRIDGKPMRRANLAAARQLLDDSA
ncbi:hypothetical protein DFR29_110193 [Tahibacter aquaticus]|uniref:Uncharacterized protein n=1 Tax=Tahibacter aquaticus TaxID=520092 RepID=A0A4R6YU10_9GAMM|nr:hypothetical protein [Tahibacter aquaticus]TDR41710.1 hypothetical protein DFR29_110193 [Tahibacter aquaticus]